jgi:hypothetical protein
VDDAARGVSWRAEGVRVDLLGGRFAADGKGGVSRHDT